MDVAEVRLPRVPTMETDCRPVATQASVKQKPGYVAWNVM